MQAQTKKRRKIQPSKKDYYTGKIKTAIGTVKAHICPNCHKPFISLKKES